MKTFVLLEEAVDPLETSTDRHKLDIINLAREAMKLHRFGEVEIATSLRISEALSRGLGSSNDMASVNARMIRAARFGLAERSALMQIGIDLAGLGYKPGSHVKCGDVVVRVEPSPMPAKILGVMLAVDDTPDVPEAPGQSDREYHAELGSNYAAMTRVG